MHRHAVEPGSLMRPIRHLLGDEMICRAARGLEPLLALPCQIPLVGAKTELGSRNVELLIPWAATREVANSAPRP